MAVFQSLEQARAHFEQERFAVVSGMVIDEIGEDWSRVSVELTEMHRSADGGITGGVIFTLADFACAAAMNQIHLPSVAQQVSISYLSAPRGKKLFACARCRKNGRTSAVLDVDVTDDTGRDIAQAAAIGFKLDARPADIQK